MAKDPTVDAAIRKVHEELYGKKFRFFARTGIFPSAERIWVQQAFDAAFSKFVPYEQELSESMQASDASLYQVGSGEWTLAVITSAAGRHFKRFIVERIGEKKWGFTEHTASVARDAVSVERA
jgi:hypothetical protein